MITALFRISSNEVVKISVKGQPFDARDATFWGVLTDPPLPDGDRVRELPASPGDEDGQLRQLGFAKINDSGTVRNATQAEIDGWQAPEDDDENIQDADDAKALLANHPLFRKAFISFAKVMMSEINILRAQAGLPDRTLSQLKTALQNQVSKDD